jgi:hypothetical protein
MKTDESTFVTVFSGSSMDAEIIKQYLESNGVMATIRNQFMGTIAPWQVSGGGTSPADVEVLEHDRQAALALINGFENDTSQE